MGWRFVLASGLNIFRPGDQTTFKNQGFGGNLVQDFIFSPSVSKKLYGMILGPRCFKCSLTNSGEKIVHRLRHPGGTPRTPKFLLSNYSLRCQDPLAPEII